MTKSDLILDYSPLNAALPHHSPVHTESYDDGFAVISSTHENNSYSTLICDKIWADTTERRRALVRLTSKHIHRHCCTEAPKAVLVVGLGSAVLTSDSLGPSAASRIIVNPEFSPALPMPRVSVISPGVPAKTGIDTAVIVRSIAKEVGAELIITVDSLSATSAERLCRVIQITDCGITPGSALAHSSGEISKSTMPCPVISIGVPTVIRGETLSQSPDHRDLLVSPADADIALDCYAAIIGSAINSFLLEILREQ